jgi:hypothetical protein
MTGYHIMNPSFWRAVTHLHTHRLGKIGVGDHAV